MEFRNCLNLIGASAGHPFFFLDRFWTGRYFERISRIFRPYGLMEHKSVNDIAMCIFPCTSVTVSEHLACREHFLNAVSTDKYWDNFLDAKNNLDIFRRYFVLALDFLLDRI